MPTTLSSPPARVADSGDVLAPVVAELRREAARLFGRSDAEFEELARIERPYSRISRLRVRGSSETELFAKVARLRSAAPGEYELMRARVVNDYAITDRVYRAMPHERGLSSIKPIACYPDLLAIVTERANGVTLLDAAESFVRMWSAPARRPAMPETAEQVGAWLAAFQLTDSSQGEVTGESLREYIDIRLARLAEDARAAFSSLDRTTVLQTLDRHLSELKAADLRRVPIHGDVALGNVLVDGPRVIGLDYAMTTTGTQYDDVAHMFFQLGLLGLKPHFSQTRVAALQQGLLKGFASTEIEREPLFRVMQLQHTACHYLGLVERPSGGLSKAYNTWVAHSHRGWLRRFAEGRL